MQDSDDLPATNQQTLPEFTAQIGDGLASVVQKYAPGQGVAFTLLIHYAHQTCWVSTADKDGLKKHLTDMLAHLDRD